MRIKTLTLFLVLLISAATAFGQETANPGSDDGPLSIAWEAVEGAATYRVEIRKDNAIFIDTETTELEMTLDLAPGDYDYRILVMDPFGNEASTTEWTTLKIQRARTPYFRVTEPVITWESDKVEKLYLEIIYITDKLEFTLANGETIIPVERTIEGEQDYIRVGLNGMAPGEWDLTAMAASGLRFTHPGALVIRPTRPPEIGNIDTTVIFAEGLVPLTVSGESFDEDMNIAVKGSSGYIEIAAVEVTDVSTAVAYLNMNGVEPGSYDLILANPAGEKTVREDAITVEAPIEELKPKVQPRFEFHLGWTPMIAGAPGDSALVLGLATFETALTFHSGWTKPFVNGLGIETRAVFGFTNYIEGDSVGFDYLVKADLSGYWRPPVRGKAAPVFILGFGNMWSGYAEAKGVQNMLFLRLGVGVDFSTFTRFTRIGLNFELGFTNDNTVPMLSLMFRRGFRF